jgi:hypothetical protein
MELVLNLLWLMLVVPAFWLWRGEPVSVGRSRRFDPVACVLCLVCILILLFPVISASDDLQAMRQETVESGSTPSKRIHRQAADDKDTPSLSVFVAALAPSVDSSFEVWGEVLTQQIPLPAQAQACTRAVRAPPFSFLG